MKRITALLAILWLIFSAAHAQQDTTTYYGKSKYIFQHLDKTQITTGLMSDYGIEFMPLADYDGVSLTNSNYVGIQEWRLLYASVYSSQINDIANLVTLESVNNQINNYSIVGQPITFAVMHYTYQSMREDALSANLITVNNDQMFDVSGRNQSPYQNKQLFAVAPLRQAAVTGNNSVIFRPEMFFSNTGKTIGNIGIDVGESGTFQIVNFNSPFSINLTELGIVPIAIRITYTDSSVAYAHTKLMVYPTQDENNNSLQSYQEGKIESQRFGPNTGNIITNEVVTASKAYLGVFASGDITVQLSLNNNSGQIQKPLIVIEGFDMYNSFTFTSFTNSITYDENQVFSSYINLNDQLDDINSYDLIFLNFSQATDYIQRNAYLLEKVIEMVNNRKINYNGIRQSNIVVGLSMGGLVGRYALRDMELNNLSHETRLFITHDTPHHGANVPVAFQVAVQHLAPFKIINGVSATFDYPPIVLDYRDMFPELMVAQSAFNSIAARQMLIQRYQLSGNTLNPDNSISQSFFTELNNMGWPVNSKNLTISNGSCGGENLFPANSSLLEISGYKPMTYIGNLFRSALMTIAGPYIPIAIQGGNVNAMNLFIQFPLSSISTRTSLNLDFRVNAVPEGGIAELYRGDIYIKRKLAWIINSTSYFVKMRINSTSEMLPLDNAPGGVYDMNNFGLDVNGLTGGGIQDFFSEVSALVKQPKFCFVPTVSSLAISQPWQKLKSNLCQSVNCLNPSDVNNYYAPQENQLHTSFTQLSSDWILKWQDPTLSCVKTCISNLAIIGPSAICESANYSIINLPVGASVKWKLNQEGIVSISDVNSPDMVLNKLDVGQVILTAEVSGGAVGCDVIQLQAIIIKVGNPYYVLNVETNSNGLGGGSDLCNHAYDYDDYVNTFNISLNELTSESGLVLEYQMWGPTEGNYGLALSGLITNYAQNPSRAFRLPAYAEPGYYVLDVRVKSISYCDTPTDWYEVGFYYKNCGTAMSSNTLSVFPNPANNQITISLGGQTDESSTAKTAQTEDSGQVVTFVRTAKQSAKIVKAPITAILYNEQMSKIVTQSIEGNSGIMDTSQVSDGTYYLHIEVDGVLNKKQIVIKH
ncbi:hypothetical protein [Pedobacter sp. MW01-1-1]|uniref:hypothetical protein n=1 Tax=Pedobacter sp. MW01-1-1 TaxID=3383027 RepID=UPI003FF0F6A9